MRTFTLLPFTSWYPTVQPIREHTFGLEIMKFKVSSTWLVARVAMTTDTLWIVVCVENISEHWTESFVVKNQIYLGKKRQVQVLHQVFHTLFLWICNFRHQTQKNLNFYKFGAESVKAVSAGDFSTFLNTSNSYIILLI